MAITGGAYKKIKITSDEPLPLIYDLFDVILEHNLNSYKKQILFSSNNPIGNLYNEFKVPLRFNKIHIKLKNSQNLVQPKILHSWIF